MKLPLSAYNHHYLAFYSRDGIFKFVVTSELPGTDLAAALEIDDEFEIFEVYTNLVQDDFFDVGLFRNAKAVYRYAKQVTARENAA